MDDTVRRVYPGNLWKNLRNTADRNTRTHLEKLREEGRISEDAAAYRLENGGKPRLARFDTIATSGVLGQQLWTPTIPSEQPATIPPTG